MQVCTSFQTDNHASTPPLSFFTGRMPFLPPNQQRQSTEGSLYIICITTQETMVFSRRPARNPKPLPLHIFSYLVVFSTVFYRFWGRGDSLHTGALSLLGLGISSPDILCCKSDFWSGNQVIGSREHSKPVYEDLGLTMQTWRGLDLKRFKTCDRGRGLEIFCKILITKLLLFHYSRIIPTIFYYYYTRFTASFPGQPG